MSLKDIFTNQQTTSKFGLAGEKGPEFENEGQIYSSDIQTKTETPKSDILESSQDLLSGRNSKQIPLHPYYQRPTSLSLKAQPPVTGPYKDKGPVDGKY